MSTTKSLLSDLSGNKRVPKAVDLAGVGRVYVRVLTGSELWQFQQLIKGDDISWKAARTLIELSVCEKDGSRSFNGDAVSVLDNLPAVVATELYRQAAVVNGLTSEVQADTMGKSETITEPGS